MTRIQRAVRVLKDELNLASEGARAAGHARRQLLAGRWEYLLQAAAPTGPGDFRLLLWLEAWELAPRDEYVAGQVQRLEDQWLEMLSDILRHGRDTGELETEDLESFALRFSALMDGLTIQVVMGSPHIDRRRMLEICRDVCRTELRWKLT